MSEISQVRVRKMIMITEQGKEALSARIAWQAICRVHVLCSSPPHTRPPPAPAPSTRRSTTYLGTY